MHELRFSLIKSHRRVTACSVGVLEQDLYDHFREDIDRNPSKSISDTCFDWAHGLFDLVGPPIGGSNTRDELNMWLVKVHRPGVVNDMRRSLTQTGVCIFRQSKEGLAEIDLLELDSTCSVETIEPVNKTCVVRDEAGVSLEEAPTVSREFRHSFKILFISVSAYSECWFCMPSPFLNFLTKRDSSCLICSALRKPTSDKALAMPTWRAFISSKSRSSFELLVFSAQCPLENFVGFRDKFPDGVFSLLFIKLSEFRSRFDEDCRLFLGSTNYDCCFDFRMR
ncbi:hypothetical protein KCU90_g28, partial [Aureobasidium melanogenum]